MGLFMDADGIPMAFDIFPGNQNEQTTLKLLESKILQDFGCSEFIFCSDAGLGSAGKRCFNPQYTHLSVFIQADVREYIFKGMLDVIIHILRHPFAKYAPFKRNVLGYPACGC